MHDAALKAAYAALTQELKEAPISPERVSALTETIRVLAQPYLPYLPYRTILEEQQSIVEEAAAATTTSQTSNFDPTRKPLNA